MFQDEQTQYQYNFMQMLNNLFKVCWKLKKADIICYMLSSLIYLEQENVKKHKSLMNIVQYWRRKFSYLSNDLRNFNEIIKMILNVTKKQGFISSGWIT